MMRVVIRGRMGGKTHEAVQWLLADPDRVLLVMDMREAARLRKEYGLEPHQVIVARDAAAKLPGRRAAVVGVDNIDMLDWRTLLELGRLPQPIELATETRRAGPG